MTDITIDPARPHDFLTVGLAQMAPVWLDRQRTIEKVADNMLAAADKGCDLVTFGEALIPGYPFWIERTDGARFNDPRQKEIFSLYLDQGVVIERGDLDPLCEIAKARKIAVYVGCMERAPDRGGHSLYCSLVHITRDGEIASVHRKLQPTYEERLAWSPGDGHGLRVHPMDAFTLGGLNCFENWLPLARAALYGQGEDLHVAVWPGGLHNTFDTTKFIAKESRSYVISVSGLMRPEDVGAHVPSRDMILENTDGLMANGGSCLSGPDGEWIIEPQVGEEGLYTAVIDHARVREERQNFDVVGHYSRPDVTHLQVNRDRQSTVSFSD